MTVYKTKKPEVSITELQGIIPHDPKRKPPTIREMDEAIMRYMRKKYSEFSAADEPSKVK